MSAAEDALVEALMRAMAMHFAMNRMPHMSGDPLNRLGAMERRRLDDAARAALAALRAHRPDVAAALDGWRTLDSAPRCGADFLMHYPRHSAINVVSWRGGMWQDADGWRLDDGSARAGGCLWHPLPPPPGGAP